MKQKIKEKNAEIEVLKEMVKSANTQIKDHDHSQPSPPPRMDAHSVLRDLESLDASRKDVLLALSQPRPIHVIVFLQSGRHFREAMSALKT